MNRRTIAGALIVFSIGPLAGCYSERKYLLDRATVDDLRRLSWDDRRRIAVPAVRNSDDAHVYVRGDSVELGGEIPDSQFIPMKARSFNYISTTIGLPLLLTGLGATLASGSLVFAESVNRGPGGIEIGVLVVCALRIVAGIALIAAGYVHRPQEVDRKNPRFTFPEVPATR